MMMVTAMGTLRPFGFSGAMRAKTWGKIREAAAEEKIHQLEDSSGGSGGGASGCMAVFACPPSKKKKCSAASHGRRSKTSWNAASVTLWSRCCFRLVLPCWNCVAQFFGVTALWCLLAMPALLCLGCGPLLLSCRCDVR
jgi:hypothetical protein